MICLFWEVATDAVKHVLSLADGHALRCPRCPHAQLYVGMVLSCLLNCVMTITRLVEMDAQLLARKKLFGSVMPWRTGRVAAPILVEMEDISCLIQRDVMMET